MSEDGLPDPTGCVLLVEAFWAQVHQELDAWSDEREADLAAAHYNLTHQIRHKAGRAKVKHAETRVKLIERTRNEAQVVVDWIEGRDKTKGNDFAFWCEVSGASTTQVAKSLRVAHPKAFASFSKEGAA